MTSALPVCLCFQLALSSPDVYSSILQTRSSILTNAMAMVCLCVCEREIAQWEQFHLSLSSLNRLANFSAAFCLVFLVGLVSDLTFTVRLTSLTSIPPSYAPLFLFFRVCHHSTTAEHTLLQHTSVTQYWTFSPAVCSQSRFEVKATHHWAPALLRVVCSAHCCSPLWLATALPDPPPTKSSKKTDDITVS